MQKFFLFTLSFFVLLALACTAPKVRLFDNVADPLQEFVIGGKAPKKILVIPVRGVISDAPSKGLLTSKPSMVQEIVSQLHLAEKDTQLGAVLLKIDSPGGTSTASDILYNELMEFKKRSGKKLVAALMGMATSGGYYISLAADRIVAHPTTVTGSVGVVFMGPKLTGFLDKVGVEVEVIKSGIHKDMGSPFRQSTEDETEIINALIHDLADRFTFLVSKHRNISDAHLKSVSSARIYSAQEALYLNLIDKIGYLDQAIEEARDIAHLPKEPKIIMYRRTEYADDNIYNTATMRHMSNPTLVDISPLSSLTSFQPGFYYLWAPSFQSDTD